MAQAGLHAAVGYQMSRIVPYEKRLFPALIFGAMVPDLDIIFVAAASFFYTIPQAEDIFHRTFSHSLFTLIFVYLFFAIISELKKKPILKSLGKGLALGMLTHYILDTFIWFKDITLFWPLPLDPINVWNSWEPSYIIFSILLAFEFFCFRWYAWFLISCHLRRPNRHSWFIQYLSMWKSIEMILFILFILLIIWNQPFINLLFGIVYIPSLIMALYSTYMSREALEFKSE